MPDPHELENNRILATALENLTEGVVLVDPEGQISHMNAEALRIHGFGRLSDLIREIEEYPALYQLTDDQGRSLSFEEWPVRRLYRGERFQSMEVWVRHSVRGQPRRFCGSYGGTPVLDDRGSFAGGILTVRDITEQKRTQRALEERDRELEQMFRESHAFITVMSVPEYRFIKSNPVHDRIYGRSDLVGKRIAEVLPDYEGQGVVAVLDEVVRSGKPFTGTELAVRFNDAASGGTRTRYFNLSFQPLRDGQDRIYAIAAQGNDVTEAVVGRQAVDNERENFRALFRQTPEMVVILRGPEHVFEFVNEAHVRVLGFDATGKTVREAQPESVEVHGILDDVYRTGKTAELHEIPVTVGDRLRYFNLTYAARRDPEGVIDGIMILGVEVTEQVLGRRQMRLSEETFRRLADAIPQIVWVARPDGSVSYYNQRWISYTGQTMEEAARRGMQDVIHPEDLARVYESWQSAARAGTRFESEYRLRARDGTYRWFLGRSVPLVGADGRVEQFFGTATDIDETKRAQVAQEFLDRASLFIASSLDYQTTLQRVADLAVTQLADWCGIDLPDEHGILQPLIVAHRDPTRVEFAREFRRRYPTRMDEPAGAPQVFRTGTPELYSDVTDEMLVAGALDPDHLRAIRELGLASVMIVPIKIKDQPIGILTLVLSSRERRYGQDDLATATELARRAALAIENSRLIAELRAAIQARDEFLSIASHELRTPITPITPIKLQLQYLSRSIEQGRAGSLDPERVRTAIDASTRQLSRLTALVDDLLDVARISTGRLNLNRESQDLVELMREVTERYRAQAAAAGMALEVDLPREPVVVSFDRLRVEQVVINLIANAIKYAPGAPLHVSMTGPSAAPGAMPAGGRVRITVRDRGPGIAEEFLERVFERFERVPALTSVGGLGLGLYISRQIVEAHAGRIWVESRRGEGAAFVVELPV